MAEHLRRILVIGATSGIAEHCLRLWAQTPAEFLLVGRSSEKLEQISADLRVRSPDSLVNSEVINFLDTAEIAQLSRRFSAQSAIDIALVAHGTLPDQSQCQQDLEALVQAQQINSLSPMLFCEALATVMARQTKGCIGIIGSVAGDRGRRSNYIYGAAKGALERYAQGLQHRFASSGPRVCLIKPGPTSTPMTDHMVDGGLALAPVEAVAACIVKGMEKGRPVIYAPARWRIIMTVIRHLPRFIFNRLDI